MPQQSYQIERVTTENDLLALKGLWQTLLAGIPEASLFVTWEWLSTWWRHFGKEGDLWLLVAWDGDGRLAGIAPWALIQDRWGPLSLRRVTFMSSRSSMHMDILARTGEKEAVCAAFLNYLMEHIQEWDALDLGGLVRNPILPNLMAAAPGRYLEKEIAACTIIHLPGDWNTYYSSLSKKRRKNLRYYHNRLERETSGHFAFHRVATEDELSQAIDSLVALNRKRRHGMGRTSAFDNERFVQFNHEISQLALAGGWLRLFELRVEGKTIAALCCFRYRELYYAYRMGFDPDWSSCSPALLLLAHAIQEAITEDVQQVDLLRGSEHHKLVWTDRMRPNSHLLLSRSWRGDIWLAGARLFDQTQEWAREHVSEDIRARVNVFLSNKRARTRIP